MSLYLLFRFLHVTAAIIFIGGIVARQLVRSAAARTENVGEFATLSRAAGRLESLMVIPGNMAVIGFGVILALITGAPIFGFLQGAGQNWLLVTNILLVLGLLVVPLVFIPRGKVFDLALEEALAEGRMTPRLRERLDDKVVRSAHLFELVSLGFIVILMVFKPF